MNSGSDDHLIPENDNDFLPFIPGGRKLLALSAVSALVYLLISLALFAWFHEGGISQAFAHGSAIINQLLIGGAAGTIMAGFIMFLSGRPPVSDVLGDFYIVKAISQSRFSLFDRVQLSLFAGAGEELLFRGALQPVLGIWLTSAIFVGIHGYFKFKTTGHLIFAVMMFGLSMLLGILFEQTGLISAMAAHAAYDVLLLWWVQGRDISKR